jgi:hypothetical protein
VLSLSVAALATWFGIETAVIFSTQTDFALYAPPAPRSFVWRFANRKPDFARVLERATNIAFWGALTLTADRSRVISPG